MKKYLHKNLLVIGSTGSGRSNFIDKLITSLLQENNPENLKLLLIDPKKVNFAQYNGVAHLLSDVISGPEKAKSGFKWAWGESLRRLKVIEELGIEAVSGYENSNKNFRNKFPEIVIVVEELADFMVADKKFFENYIKRITALSEITGMYVVIATARSIPEVLTKKVKSSFWERIIFRLPSEKDSIFAMGDGGAEKLDKPGLCLAKDFIDSAVNKVQMPFISEEETMEIIESIKSKYTDFQILMNAKDVAEERQEDVLYEKAKDIVVKSGKASSSLLQRRLLIGYSRAAMLIDMLEENGVIGEADGAKPREVLIDMPK
jgi:DNA segregation ATPase FtsK/SpoIIIE, S-DNA-T family